MHNGIGATHASIAALQPAQHDVIHASHERSATFGLYSSMRPDYAVLSGAELHLLNPTTQYPYSDNTHSFGAQA